MAMFDEATQREGNVAALLLAPDGHTVARWGPRPFCRAMLAAGGYCKVRRSRCRQRLATRGRVFRVPLRGRHRCRPSKKELSSPGTQAKAATSLTHDDKIDNLSHWMQRLPDDMLISRVSIPGTHDTASFEMWSLPASWQYLRDCAQTQEWDLQTQLSSGIRFLDLRVKSDGWLYHGPVACTLRLETALQTCQEFLVKQPTEFILVRLKDEEQSSSSGKQIHGLVAGLAKQMSFQTMTEMATVGAVRGQLVLLQDWEGPSIGLQWDGPMMRIQDQFRQSTTTEKWRQVRQHFGRSMRSSRRKLCINFISAHCLPRLTARDFAMDLNSRLSEYLSSCSNCSSLGVVVLDFASKQLCSQIVRANMLHVEAPQLLSALQSTATSFAVALRHLDAAHAEPSLDKAAAFGLGDLGSKCSRSPPELVARIYTKLLVRRAACAALEAYVQCCCENSRKLPRNLQMLSAVLLEELASSTFRVRRRLRRASESGSGPAVEQTLQTNLPLEAPRIYEQESRAKPVIPNAQLTTFLETVNTHGEMDGSRLQEMRSSTSSRLSKAGSSRVQLFRGSNAHETAKLTATTAERSSAVQFLSGK